MKRFYPVFLDLEGKEVLVVGGGTVSLRKVRALREAGARVTVVAPDIAPEIRETAGVRPVRRKFKDGDLEGPGAKALALVVAATDDEALNARIFRLCEARGIWVNAVDRPTHCSFIVPAVVRRGPVTFAVSTGGASPALTAFLAGRLRGAFGPEVARTALALARLRPKLKTVPMGPRRDIVAKAIARASAARFAPAALKRMERDILSALKDQGAR